MSSTMLTWPLDRIQKLCRNAEKTLALECRTVQSVLDNLPAEPQKRAVALRHAADLFEQTEKKIATYLQASEKSLLLCKTRLEFARSDHAQDPDTLLNWLLIGYLLRRGWIESAKKLVEDSDLQHVIDMGLFEQAHHILRAFEEKDTGPAIAWCVANKQKLSAFDSSLELNLRLRNFIRLLERDQLLDAVVFARQHLAPFFTKHQSLIQKYFALFSVSKLLFQENGSVLSSYSDLLQGCQWHDVRQMFLQDFFRLHKLPRESLLDTHLKAGLSALKSKLCGSADRSMSDCPVCAQDVVELSAKIEPCPRTISCLICRFTGKVMDESNPPIALPNGQVYSQEAIQRLASINGGTVRCPETGAEFQMSQCRPVYVA